MNIDIKRETFAACIASLEICLAQFEKNHAPPHIIDAADRALKELLAISGMPRFPLEDMDVVRLS